MNDIAGSLPMMDIIPVLSKYFLFRYLSADMLPIVAK
jgi:hypothetical protein